jgi:hypothetical protein
MEGSAVPMLEYNTIEAKEDLFAAAKRDAQR